MTLPSIFDYLPEHAEGILKTALAVPPQQSPQPAKQPGKMQTYMPWYGAAGLGALGAHYGGKVLPKKYKLLGQVGGTLLGTAMGVHGGEAVGKRLDRSKTAAEQEPVKKPWSHAAKTVGTGLAGLGVGTLAGYGASKGLQAALRSKGVEVPDSLLTTKVLPLAGGGAGTAYALWKAKEMEELKRAVEGARNKGQ